MDLINRKVIMQSPSGLHLELASAISKVTSSYKAEIFFSSANHTANANSIFGLVTLRVACGDTLEISAQGQDAVEALEAVCLFLDSHSTDTSHRFRAA